MAWLIHLPDELMLLILDKVRRIGPYHAKGPGHELLNIACVCKMLHRVAIPTLCEKIDIGLPADRLIELAYRLLNDEKLSRSVKRLTCSRMLKFGHRQGDVLSHSSSDLLKLIGPYFASLGFPDEEIESWNVPIRKHNAVFIYSIIALLCPNLTVLDIPTGPVTGDTYEKVSIFKYGWKWENLQELCFALHSSSWKNNGAVSLIDDFQPRKTYVLPVKRLACDYLNVIDAASFSNLSRLASHVSFLELWLVQDHERSAWVSLCNLVRSCHSLEGFVIDFSDIRLFNVVPYFASLLEALESQKETLKVFKFRFQWDQYDEFEDEPINGLKGMIQDAPRANDAFDFTKFQHLMELRLPMPSVFGVMFFFKRPGPWNELDDEDGEIDPPKPEFGHQYANVLIKSLPPSLQVLQITIDWFYQAQAVACALKGLLENRSARFPNFRKLSVEMRHYDTRSAFESFLQEPSVLDARNQGVLVDISPAFFSDFD